MTDAEALAVLAAVLTGDVSARPGDLDAHSRDEHHPTGATPRAVVFAAARTSRVKVLFDPFDLLDPGKVVGAAGPLHPLAAG